MALKVAIQNHLVAFIGEFVGTFLFLFFAFAGVQTASQNTTSTTGADPAKLLYISTVFGLSLAINVWIFFRVSGGLFNPAVTMALCVCGVVPVLRSTFVVVAQLLGGIAAAEVVKYIIPGQEVLFNNTLGPGVTVTQGLLIEAFLTFELVFTILMLAAEKTKATFIAPIGIGFALFIGHMVGVFWTGAGINPARAFGPNVAILSFPTYHWIYWIGPILGGLVASGFYLLLKKLHYEDVNGDQDKSADEQSLLEAHSDFSRKVQNWNPHLARQSQLPRGKDAPELLRLYRLSGLDGYKQKNQEAMQEEGQVEHQERIIHQPWMQSRR